MNKKFYILSTGRCGTTFLSRLIQQNDPSLSNIHQQKDSKGLNIQANLAISSKWYKKRFVASLSRKYAHALPPSTTDPLRSVAYLLYLEILFEENPGLRDNTIIIHLVRDPRDFVSSFMNWKNRKLSGRIAHHLTPFWMPQPKLIERFLMTKFEHFCWIWNRKNLLFSDGFSNLPDYHLYKMEDLQAGSEKLNELHSLITGRPDIKTETESWNHNSPAKKSFPYWKNWPPAQAKKLHDNCACLMEQYGYGQEADWLKLIRSSNHEE